MPRRDGTGPMGMGPMTGSGFGFCGNKFYGRGNCYGMGYGRSGYGFGYRPVENITQKEYLQKQKDFLKFELEQINKELNELEDLKD